MKKILLLSLLFFASFSLFCQKKVDVEEIKTSQAIEFVNFTGPYAYRESAAAIRGIGRRLARGLNNSNEYRYLLKYSVIHAIDDTTSDLYDADIISIDEDARVEHIRNVRAIIAAYLEASYGYKRKDAATLAFFISIYNAVYRKNVDYFTSRYKPVVMQHVNADNVGLSTQYFEWAGQTKLLIPLTADIKRGNLSSLDTAELSEEQVVDQLRQEEDKAIEERKALVQLKEKEVAQKSKEAQEERREVQEQKREVKEQEKVIAEKEVQIQAQEQELDVQKQEAEKIEDPEEKEEKLADIAEQEEEISQEKEQLETEKAQVESQKEEIAEQEEQVAEKEAQIAQKKEEISQEKAVIKRDETELKIEEDPGQVKEELLEKEAELTEKEKELEQREQAVEDKESDEKMLGSNLYYLKIKEYLTGGHYNNEMYIVDAATRKVKVRSSVKNICGSRYDVFPEGVVVITRQEGTNDSYYLTLLDKDQLSVKYLGTDYVFWRTFIETRDDFIYAIIKEGENYHLGKFNKKMETVAKSRELISNDTFISFFEGTIYINGKDNKILVLKTEDLSLEEELAF